MCADPIPDIRNPGHLPRNVHRLPYIEFYTRIGFSRQEAEKFYYFTINAAPADDIHWLTPAEIREYTIATPRRWITHR